jgi:hypothetical protein
LKDSVNIIYQNVNKCYEEYNKQLQRGVNIVYLMIYQEDLILWLIVEHN